MSTLRAPMWLLVLSACAAPRWENGPAIRLLDAAGATSLRGVSAVSGSIAWVSGTGGTCLRTVDGGATWQPCHPNQAAGRDLRDVHAFDALRAVVLVIGSPALLLHTDDGGASWRTVFRDEHPEAFLDAMDFTSTGVGFAFGDPLRGRFLALRTFDGGRTWEATAAPPPPLPGEAAFAASGSCVAVLPDSTFLAATGGAAVARVLRGEGHGARWHTSTTPLRSGGPSRGAFSIAVDGPDAVLVGGDHESPADTFGNLAVSHDGGRSWHRPEGRPPRGYRSAVAHVPGTHGRLLLCTGPTGTDVSRNGGHDWEALTDDGFHALSFAPDGSGYAVGADGRIARIEARR